MKTTTYYAAKDLQIDDAKISKGDVLFTVESDAPVEKLLKAIENGSATTDKPKADAPAAPTAPVTGAPATEPK